MLNSERNTHVLAQTDPSNRQLAWKSLLKYNKTIMKTLYSFIDAILFHKNRLTSDCRKQEPPGSISLLLYNLMIMVVTGTNSVFFAKIRTGIFFKRKLGLDLSFLRKATGIFDV